MAVGYACLQVTIGRETQALCERAVYAISGYMDTLGLAACGKERAERTVALVRIDGGLAVYDDCADRLDIHSLDGLGRCLTKKLRAHAVGVMRAGGGMMLRLYCDGFLRDTYLSSSQEFRSKTGMRCVCHGHPTRWRCQLGAGSFRKLGDAFRRGSELGEAIYPELKQLLGLRDTADYGFSSIESAGLQDVIYLYFCASNRVRQGLLARLIRPVRQAASAVGAFFAGR